MIAAPSLRSASSNLFRTAVAPTCSKPRAVAAAAAVVPASRSYASAAPTSAYAQKPGNDGKYTVTLVPGDGIGPEVADSVKDIYKEAKVPINWEEVDVTPEIREGRSKIPIKAEESIRRTTLALKGM